MVNKAALNIYFARSVFYLIKHLKVTYNNL